MPLIDTARRMRAAIYALVLVVTAAAGTPAQAETTELNERRSAKTFLEYLDMKAASYRSNYAAELPDPEERRLYELTGPGLSITPKAVSEAVPHVRTLITSYNVRLLGKCAVEWVKFSTTGNLIYCTNQRQYMHKHWDDKIMRWDDIPYTPPPRQPDIIIQIPR